MEGASKKILIDHKLTIIIFNTLRSIGLNTTHRGTKYINKAIQLLIISDNDIVVINNVYENIANMYENITQKQIKNDIAYALNNRVEEKTKRNFEKIFGFEYDSYFFTNKVFIEEVTRIIKEEFIN